MDDDGNPDWPDRHAGITIATDLWRHPHVVTARLEVSRNELVTTAIRRYLAEIDAEPTASQP